MEQEELEENKDNKAEQEITEETLEGLKKALAEEKEQSEIRLANWQRAQADFINYKRRVEQEKNEISQFSNSVIMANLLPVLDDLERAFASIPPDVDQLPWVEGIKLVKRKLHTTLEAQGLSPINALGEAFDPYVHEAVRQDKGKEGIVIEEIQKGYKFRDKVIRPSKVVVGNGEGEEIKEADID